jgi:hypothetical protein
MQETPKPGSHVTPDAVENVPWMHRPIIAVTTAIFARFPGIRVLRLADMRGATIR